MPVVERSANRLGRDQILGWGCGGCAVAVIILCVVGYFGIRSFLSDMLTQAMSTPPPPSKHSTPYAFSYSKEAAHCSIVLPNKNGTLTYSHLLSGTYAYWGGRAIEVKDNTGKSLEWPLPYSPVTNVKVGVYWYQAKNGLGPFIRFYDAGGNSILDLGTREVGQLFNIKGRNHVANYAYDNSQFHGCSYESDAKGNILSAADAYGNPARDVSAAVTSTNCIYLGSVIRKGNSLVFQPNSGGGSKKVSSP